MNVTSDAGFDADEENTNDFNPLVPRQIDLPTTLHLDGSLAAAEGDIAKIFAAPEDPADWPAWREALVAWRTEARERLSYDGSNYDDQSTKWTADCASIALVWLWDERLFDHAAGVFTVSGFIESMREYGGVDGVVLWHAYPVIGIDDRNQFDFYRDVPGIAEVITEMRAGGIRVFINYNPWDTGTRRAAHDDATELSILAAELKVDGVFLDTLKEGDAALTKALRSSTPPQVLEGESRIPLARIEDHQLSWAQWFADSDAPGVARAHWYERRHMMHHTRRWNRDHSDELQSSFMNGIGMLVWDAVFGVWVGWNSRDKSTLRRLLAVRRALPELFREGEWSPLLGTHPDAVAAGVFASQWQLEETILYTIINRGESDYTGIVLDQSLADGQWFDLNTGAPTTGVVTVPARSISAISSGPLGFDSEPISSDHTFPARTAVRVQPQPSRQTAEPQSIVIEAGERTLRSTFRRRETGRYQGAPYVEEWKPLPPRLHDAQDESSTVDIGRVAVARAEVTEAEYALFDGGHPIDGSAPKTGIDLNEARAYAGWKGARLPTEFEWQLAAADPDFERLSPAVWNWTESEHSDGITRFVMLKGGSDYAAPGSDWYFDGGVQWPEFSAKFLLPGLGLGRSSSIGFRLAWDLGAER
jgi:hypothetical protein